MPVFLQIVTTSSRPATSSWPFAASCSKASGCGVLGDLVALARVRAGRCWRWRRSPRGSLRAVRNRGACRFGSVAEAHGEAAGLDARSLLVWKDFLELRQRSAAVWRSSSSRPSSQLTLLGYAATTDVRNVPMVVADEDRSAESRELISRFDVRRTSSSPTRWPQRARSTRFSTRGGVDGARHSRAATASAFARGVPVLVQVVADGTDANSTNVALGYAGRSSPATRASWRRADAAAARSAPLVDARSAGLVQPAAREPLFMIPGSWRCCCSWSPPTCRRWPSCARRSSARSSSST